MGSLAFRPVSILGGLLGGLIASKIFEFIWGKFADEEAPEPGHWAASSRCWVWMWITNLALLFGVELNAERERSRELGADVSRADREIQLQPRAEPRDQRST